VRREFVDSAIETTNGPLGLGQTDHALGGRVRAMVGSITKPPHHLE
jgi:hypothetical protein